LTAPQGAPAPPDVLQVYYPVSSSTRILPKSGVEVAWGMFRSENSPDATILIVPPHQISAVCTNEWTLMGLALTDSIVSVIFTIMYMEDMLEIDLGRAASSPPVSANLHGPSQADRLQTS
jgi:hypothetical protein